MGEAFGNDGAGVSHGGGRVIKGKSRGIGASGGGKGKMGPPAEKGWVEKWRTNLKIAGVSFFCFGGSLFAGCLWLCEASIPSSR